MPRSSIFCLIWTLLRFALQIHFFFKDNAPDSTSVCGSTSVSAEVAMQESRIFMSVVGYGHTQGFTRPLRELYMLHKDIARSMHSCMTYGCMVSRWPQEQLAS